jgi:hypothetical protein
MVCSAGEEMERGKRVLPSLLVSSLGGPSSGKVEIATRTHMYIPGNQCVEKEKCKERMPVCNDRLHVLAPLIPIGENDFALVQRGMKEVPHLDR